MGGGGQMAGEEVGKGEFVGFACEMGGLGEEFPAEELGGFQDAVWTVLLHWSFCACFGFEDHFESLDADFWLMGCEDQLTG